MGSPYLERTDRRFAHGLMFHHLHGAGHPPVQGSIDAQALADIIEFAGGRGSILDAPEWQTRAVAGTLGEGDLCLTFDDGLRCQLEVAGPVLERYGLRAFFFVYTAPLAGVRSRLEVYRRFRTTAFPEVEAFYAAFEAEVTASEHAARCRQALRDFRPDQYLREFPFYSYGDRRFRFLRDEVLGPAAYEALMDRMIARYADVRELARGLWLSPEDLRGLAARGHVIGIHSHSHPTTLVGLGREAQEVEYRTACLLLERLVGVRARAMSHPCNSYDPATLEILREAGIEVGFRGDCPGPAASPLEFPREDHANLVALLRA